MKKKTTPDFQELIIAARKALSEGNQTEARLHSETLITRFPKSEEGWLILASLSTPQEALVYLENALRENPKSQTVRQGIRLVTSQLLNEKKNSIPSVEKLVLEDTQPVSVNIAEEAPSIPEIDKQGEESTGNLDADQLQIQSDDEQKLFLEKVSKASASIEAAPADAVHPEIPHEDNTIERTPKNPSKLEAEPEVSTDDKKPDNQEMTIIKEQVPEKKNIRIIKKPVEAKLDSGHILGKKPSGGSAKIGDSGKIQLQTDVIELLLIAGAAVLLPVLVFLVFFLKR